MKNEIMNAGGGGFGGKDLDDKNIRLAPTQVELDDLEDAMELFCICVLLAEAN